MLRWAALEAAYAASIQHTNRLGSVPRGGGNGPAGSGSQMWISCLFVSGIGNKVWVISNIWGLPAPHFHLLPPQPLGGRQYSQDFPGLGDSHSPSWPLHPSFSALNSHSLGELSKILLIYVLAFWALLFWGRNGH